jgi:hypothetical protein
MSIQYDPALETIARSIEMYYALMERKNAIETIIFFPKEYFEDIKKAQDSVELVNVVHAAKLSRPP